jgi:hypothetical protein
MSKLTDEVLKDMAEYQTTRPTTYEETAMMARELLAARRVIALVRTMRLADAIAAAKAYDRPLQDTKETCNE